MHVIFADSQTHAIHVHALSVYLYVDTHVMTAYLHYLPALSTFTLGTKYPDLCKSCRKWRQIGTCHKRFMVWVHRFGQWMIRCYLRNQE